MFQAFAILRDEVKACLAHRRTPLFAVFVDFKKAFDTVPRVKLVRKLKTYHGVSGLLLQAVCAVLDKTFVIIDDGLRKSDPIPQNQGVLQGDSLSPLLFISYVADLPERLKQSGVTVILYADDVLFFSRSRKTVQDALVVLERWAEENGMAVNTDKTKVMKFRRGGQLSPEDRFLYQGREFEIVRSYEYLGITVQTKWTFTDHVRKRVLKCKARMYAIGKLRNLSLTAASKFWKVMLSPIATYGIAAVWEDLSPTQMKHLDRTKAAFFKRVLSLHRSASNRKVLLMANEDPLCEDLVRNGPAAETEAFREYLSELEAKLGELEPDFYVSPALTQDEWKGPMCSKRHVVTRFSCHGFHFALCNKPNCYEFDLCILVNYVVPFFLFFMEPLVPPSNH